MSQAQLDSARGLAGDFEKMTKKSAELAATFKTDGQWCKWYQVLAEYFPEHRPENELAGQNLTITFHALAGC